MSAELQQALSELQMLFDKKTSAKDDVSKRLARLKLQLAQSGLYFAPAEASQHDLEATRSILELGAFHSLRIGNLKAYQQYNSSLQPFYSSRLPASPNRPVTLGLELLALLSEGKLTDFHTVLEGLDPKMLDDVFVRLPVDLERWLMEGAYNKVYRARERVPREEFGFLLEKLMGTVRAQIAATIEASYPSLPISNAATLLFYKAGEQSQLIAFSKERDWQLSPTTQTFTFPSTSVDTTTPFADPAEPLSTALDASKRRGGIQRGVPMNTMVAPALKLAQQLEAIV